MNPKNEIVRVSHLLQAELEPVIVELGAADGDDSEWMRYAAQLHGGRQPRQYLVEPDADLCAVIRNERLGKSLGDARLFNWAIAATNDYRTFWRADNELQQLRASGSIRRPTGHLIEFPWCTFTETSVNTVTLDTFFADNRLAFIDLLWVDIQGAERDMIAGGQYALDRTHWLFIEAEEKELYEGQALREELLALLPQFQVVERFNWNLLLEHK